MNTDLFMKEVAEETRRFESITLAEMDGVKLMDRTDRKFLIPLSLLPAILEDARPNYRMLTVEGQKLCTYQTLYYDTPSLDLFHAHRRGRYNRYKVRSRCYVDSDLHFFEVKFKNNKGRTIKKRIRCGRLDDRVEGDPERFLSKVSPLVGETLTGVIRVDYTRLTLVNKASAERLTIDLQLSFHQGPDLIAYPKVVIAELKQEKQQASVFVEIMRRYGIREGSISKYCFGIISLHGEVPQNTFKKHWLKIKKITNQHDSIAANYHA